MTKKHYQTDFYEKKCPIYNREFTDDYKKRIKEISKHLETLTPSKHLSYVQKKFPEIFQFLEELGFDLESNFISQKTKKVRNHINTTWKEIKNSYNDKNVLYVEEDLYNGKTKEYYKKGFYKSKIHLIIFHLFSDILLTDYHFTPIDELLNSELAGKNINKINRNVGCYLKEKSNVIAIDIDNHDNKNTLTMLNAYNAVINYFGKENLIYQENSYDYGFHLFIKLNTKLNSREKNNLLKNFKSQYREFSKFIEIPQKLRFPLSYDYTPLDIKYTTCADYNNNLEQCINDSILSYIRSEGFDCKNYVLEKERKKELSEMYCREKTNGSMANMSYEQFMENEKYDLYSGERFIKMPYFVSFAISHGYSQEECFDLVISKGKGSKDCKNKSKTIRSEIKSLYKSYKAQTIIYDTMEVEEFISNIDKIPNHVLNKITNKKVLIQILVNTKQKVSSKNLEILKILLLEVVGKYFFNINNKKLLKNKNLDLKYLIGEQFSKKMCSLLKTHYDTLKNVNVYKRISDILLYSGLFSQQFSNRRGYFFDSENKGNSFCRQFYFTANKNKEIFFTFERLIGFIYNSIDFIFNKIKTNFKLRIKDSIESSIKEINSIVNIFSEGSTVNHNIMNDFQFQKMKT